MPVVYARLHSQTDYPQGHLYCGLSGVACKALHEYTLPSLKRQFVYNCSQAKYCSDVSVRITFDERSVADKII